MVIYSSNITHTSFSSPQIRVPIYRCSLHGRTIMIRVEELGCMGLRRLSDGLLLIILGTTWSMI